MNECIHPDKLDRVSAARESTSLSSQASLADVADTLNKSFVKGRLRRIPKNPRRRDIVLGLICLNVRRRHPYTELEINEYLEEALSAMSAMVDHVTCRRYLVDLGFLKRDRAGSRYFLSPPRLECVLSGDVANSAIALLQDVLDRSAR
jgi:hypothetical protein